MKTRKSNDRRQSPRSLSNDRRLPQQDLDEAINEETYQALPEYADEIEIVEDKSVGTGQPLSVVLEDREKEAYDKGQIKYTPFHAADIDPLTQHPLSTTKPGDIEKLKHQVKAQNIHGNKSNEDHFDKDPFISVHSDDSIKEVTSVNPTMAEQQIAIKPFQHKRRPGRPSSLPRESQSNEWPRKTYRFNKHTLKMLKMHQASLDEHQDLSLIINEALRDWLEARL